MQLIVITPPEDHARERAAIIGILRCTPALLHLRKPGRDADALARRIEAIPDELHHRIMVHGHPALLRRFGILGIHFPESQRPRDAPAVQRFRQTRPACRLSTAVHRLTDIPRLDGLFDAILLSPVFDSISKPGYRAAFGAEALQRRLAATDQAVIALGGIDAERIPAAAALGFDGVAVLGAVWNDPAPDRVAERLWSICRRV